MKNDFIKQKNNVVKNRVNGSKMLAFVIIIIVSLSAVLSAVFSGLLLFKDNRKTAYADEITTNFYSSNFIIPCSRTKIDYTGASGWGEYAGYDFANNFLMNTNGLNFMNYGTILNFRFNLIYQNPSNAEGYYLSFSNTSVWNSPTYQNIVKPMENLNLQYIKLVDFSNYFNPKQLTNIEEFYLYNRDDTTIACFYNSAVTTIANTCSCVAICYGQDLLPGKLNSVNFLSCRVFNVVQSLEPTLSNSYLYFHNLIYTNDLGEYLCFSFPGVLSSGNLFPLSDRTYYFRNSLDLNNKDSYNLGYNDGFNAGSDSGYDIGFTNGQDNGYNTGLNDGIQQGYNNGYNAGDTAGYYRGKNDGIAQANDYSFLGLMSAVVDAPVQAFTGLLNFNILGFNMLSFFTGLLTLALILWIVSKVLGNK